jgi:hypothetical protein
VEEFPHDSQTKVAASSEDTKIFGIVILYHFTKLFV